MHKLCLVFWKSEPRYAYKRFAYKKTCIGFLHILVPKGILSGVSSHFIGCTQDFKAFSNILTHFQNFRLPQGVSRGSHWWVILSNIVKKVIFRDFIDIKQMVPMFKKICMTPISC